MNLHTKRSVDGLPGSFPIIEVPPGAVEETEQMGTKRKFWYLDHELGLCLFKYSRHDAGEDWAEKTAEQLCLLLGLPHARYELAAFTDQRGVISPTLVGEGEALVPGNQLLVALDPTYPVQANRARVKVPQHTVSAIAGVLASPSIELPAGLEYPPGVDSAWDLFVGYLLLDALIGNTDRHHENWAAIDEIRPTGAVRRLAPTHDHGSSLGRNESEARVQERLKTADRNQTVEAYADRCISKLYRDPLAAKPLPSVDAFAAGGRVSPTAAEAWLARLEGVAPADMAAVLQRIPLTRITPAAADFALRILVHNRSRLLALRGSF
jgi:hypothetical protein